MRKYETADRIRQLMEEKNWKQVDIFNNSKPYQEKLGVKLGKSAISQYVNGVQAPDQRRLALLALWDMTYHGSGRQPLKRAIQKLICAS